MLSNGFKRKAEKGIGSVQKRRKEAADPEIHENQVWNKAMWILDEVRDLKRHSWSWIFSRPVIEMWPEVANPYRKRIIYPMDFSQIEKGVFYRRYRNVKEFERDVRATLENCITFNNENTPYYEVASSMLNDFNSLFQSVDWNNPGESPEYPWIMKLTREKALEIVEKLMADNKHFNHPVAQLWPNITKAYKMFVHFPMDLGTIKTKMLRNKYQTLFQVQDDVRLTYTNALIYNNSGDDFCNTALRLLQTFSDLVKTAIEQKDGILEEFQDPHSNIANVSNQTATAARPASTSNVADRSKASSVETSKPKSSTRSSPRYKAPEMLREGAFDRQSQTPTASTRRSTEEKSVSKASTRRSTEEKSVGKASTRRSTEEKSTVERHETTLKQKATARPNSSVGEKGLASRKPKMSAVSNSNSAEKSRTTPNLQKTNGGSRVTRDAPKPKENTELQGEEDIRLSALAKSLEDLIGEDPNYNAEIVAILREKHPELIEENKELQLDLYRLHPETISNLQKMVDNVNEGVNNHSQSDTNPDNDEVNMDRDEPPQVEDKEEHPDKVNEPPQVEREEEYTDIVICNEHSQVEEKEEQVDEMDVINNSDQEGKIEDDPKYVTQEVEAKQEVQQHVQQIYAEALKKPEPKLSLKLVEITAALKSFISGGYENIKAMTAVLEERHPEVLNDLDNIDLEALDHETLLILHKLAIDWQSSHKDEVDVTTINEEDGDEDAACKLKDTTDNEEANDQEDSDPSSDGSSSYGSGSDTDNSSESDEDEDEDEE